MQILLSPKEAADLLQLSPAVLAALRRKGSGGPPYVAIGPRSPRYRLRDLATWACRIGTRASKGYEEAYRAVVGGEANHDALREIALDAADTAQAQFEATLRGALAFPGPETPQ